MLDFDYRNEPRLAVYRLWWPINVALNFKRWRFQFTSHHWSFRFLWFKGVGWSRGAQLQLGPLSVERINVRLRGQFFVFPS